MTNLDKIFKANDVRGIYPNEINEDMAYKIGRATAKFLRTREIVVGRDNRLSSESLSKSLCEGILDEGVNILDIGLVTTPAFYLTIIKYDFKGGIMVTASHNPKEYNGFKFVKDDALPLGMDSGLDKIKKMVKKGFIRKWDGKRGRLNRREILSHYLKNILRFADIGKIKPLKIIIDTANGTAGIVVPELFKNFPIEVIHIFSELDGSFPNHDPNPVISENTTALQKKILSEHADLGVSFDGDGDRVIFFDEKGERVGPDLIAALLVHYLFENVGKILYTPVASKIFREEIKRSHNEPICSKVGHTFLKNKMVNQKIFFGAESSGHYYLKDNYYVESPFIVLIKVMELISEKKKSLSELIGPFNKYYRDREDFKVKNQNKLIKRLENKYKNASKLSLYDGLTVEFPDWWFNFRPSNTEPITRLVVEAKTKILLDKKLKEIKSLIIE
ncbi:MAG: hypothetical protein A2V69_02005 [Candidatus Portnoybacteria bacterium RBG_13_40_8]|uniref:Phosphomannomutase/phosphoglucomutase n=1 Tax=Candidatus Portnoybacteria bacterium RBG_13_40_8 TaxID=1801990 RepID=A0A1G2F5D6_9BACT|nr:MAG: hypothetical protein A2V69_02005 [Candidatus Portnoybacteria bacterium RBG_13_40_8]